MNVEHRCVYMRGRSEAIENFMTPELVQELCKREGVKDYTISNNERTYILDKNSICIEGAVSINGYSAATILVVKE